MMCVLASRDSDAVGFKFAPDTSMNEDAVGNYIIFVEIGVEKNNRAKARG